MNPIAPRLAFTAVLSLAALGAGGCASLVPEPAVGANTQPVTSVAEQYPIDASWLLDGQLVAFVTWGSSSCHPQVESVEANGSNRIEIVLDAGDTNRFCTLDFAPRVGSISTPAGIAVEAPVTLAITLEDGETVHTAELLPVQ